MNGENQTGENSNTGAAGQISQTSNTSQQGGQQTQEGGQSPQTQQQQVQIPEDLQGNAVTNERGTFVPLAVTLDERKKRQELENKIKNLEEQVWLYQINPVQKPQSVQQQQQQPPQGQAPQQPVNDPLNGIPDEEVINAGELRRAIQNMAGQQPKGQQMDDRTWETIGEQMISMVKPDFEQVIMGRFSERIRTDPMARQAILNVHPILRPFVAYRLGANQTTQQAQAGAQSDFSAAQQQGNGNLTSDQVNRMVENSQKPMSISEVAGSQAFGQANRFMNMSDQEFEVEIERVKRGG